jgi:RND family efflux transporter MFP subunit
MSADRPHRWRRFLILPPIVIGIAVLVWMAKGRQPPQLVEPGEPTRAARVIEAPLLELVPTAEGYGPVRPAKVWAAVSQVAGRVVSVHPRLRDGEILPEGSELLRIDPVDYELAQAQAQAELAELDVRASNAQASLAIEQRNLVLARSDLERKRKLVAQGTTSESAADEAERAMLNSRSAVQNLQNTLTLIPSQRALLEAKAARAARDLEHAVIHAPFDLRVSGLQVETDQYVGVGQRLFEGDSVHRVEIEAQVPMSALRRLFLGSPDVKVDPTRLDQLVREMAGLNPLVRLDLGDYVAQWQAEFVGFADTVDPQTRTMGVVVAVERPFDKVIPGYRPPLSKGMFVQVVLRGRSNGPRVVVPRSAVRGGTLLVADADSRLRRRAVRLLYSQGEVSVVEEGLVAGESVVISDLVPVVEGLLLETRVDEQSTAFLRDLGDDS